MPTLRLGGSTIMGGHVRPTSAHLALHIPPTWAATICPLGSPLSAQVADQISPLGCPLLVHLVFHVSPQLPSTWLHAGRPDPSTMWAQLGCHLCPRSASTSAGLAPHFARLGQTTSAALCPSIARLGGSPTSAKIGSPPLVVVAQIRPHFGSPLGRCPTRCGLGYHPS